MIMYYCPGNVSSIHYLAHTLLQIFCEHTLNEVRINDFQIKIVRSKFLKPISDGSIVVAPFL